MRAREAGPQRPEAGVIRRIRRWCRLYSTRLAHWREVLRQRREATPQAIAARASELAHLAQLAACSALPERDLTPLARLHKEMLALADMANKPEFSRLPGMRRRAISRNLERSRRFLLSAMQIGLPPSDRVQ